MGTCSRMSYEKLSFNNFFLQFFPNLIFSVSLSNQYFGKVEIDGSFVCGGEDIFSFDEAAMICRHLGFSGGLPLPAAKLEASFMIGINCSGSEDSISQCKTSSLLCPSVNKWEEEKKVGVARVLCYQKSGESGE